MRLPSILFVFLFIISYMTHAKEVGSLYSFNSAQKEAQFQYLLKDLRCLVCQNQDLADSNATLAVDLRQQIYDLVQEGKSDQEIIEFLTARYGDFILFNPPIKAVTAILWFGPLVFLVLGFLILIRSGFRKVH